MVVAGDGEYATVTRTAGCVGRLENVPTAVDAGPLPASNRYVIMRVEEKRAPKEGPWSVIGEAIEASLAAYPVKDSEFVHWKLAMERRYPIDLGALGSVLETRE